MQTIVGSPLRVAASVLLAAVMSALHAEASMMVALLGTLGPGEPDEAVLRGALSAVPIVAVPAGPDIDLRFYSTQGRLGSIIDVVDMLSVNNNLTAVVGPSMTLPTLYVQEVLYDTGVPHLTALAHSPELSDRGLYPTYFRTDPDLAAMCRVLLTCARHFGFTSVGAVMLDDPFGRSSGDGFVSAADRAGIHVEVRISFTPDDPSVLKFALDSVRQRGLRVMVALVPPSTLYDVLLAADASGIVGSDYVWMSPYAGYLDMDALRSRLHVARLFQNLLAPTPHYNKSSPDFIDFAARYSRVTKDTSVSLVDGLEALGDPAIWPAPGHREIAGFEMMTSVLLVINSTLAAGQDPRNHADFVHHLRQVDFHSPSGSHVTFNTSSGSGCKEVVILQFRNDLDVVITGTFDICTFSFTHSGDGFEPVLFGAYPGSTQPPTSFFADSCTQGSSHFRDVDTGLCHPCANGTSNPRGDGVDKCLDVTSDPNSDGVATDGILNSLEVVVTITGICVAFTLVGLTAYIVTLRRHRYAAEQHAKAESRFVSYVFHSLRNPASGIVSYVGFVRDALHEMKDMLVSVHPGVAAGGTILEEGDLQDLMNKLDIVLEDIANAELCTDQAVDVLDNVFDMACLSVGKLELQEHPTELNTLAAFCVGMMQGVNPSLNIRLDMAAYTPADEVLLDERGRIAVLVDQRRLRQVLIALVCNAARHADCGPVLLRVVASRKRPAWIQGSRSKPPRSRSLSSDHHLATTSNAATGSDAVTCRSVRRSGKVVPMSPALAASPVFPTRSAGWGDGRDEQPVYRVRPAASFISAKSSQSNNSNRTTRSTASSSMEHQPDSLVVEVPGAVSSSDEPSEQIIPRSPSASRLENRLSVGSWANRPHELDVRELVELAERESVCVTFEVCDCGPNMTPEEREAVFSKNAETLTGDGNGLGMLIAHQVVEAMCSTVQIDSPWTAAHTGSRFHFTLELQRLISPLVENEMDNLVSVNRNELRNDDAHLPAGALALAELGEQADPDGHDVDVRDSSHGDHAGLHINQDEQEDGMSSDFSDDVIPTSTSPSKQHRMSLRGSPVPESSSAADFNSSPIPQPPTLPRQRSRLRRLPRRWRVACVDDSAINRKLMLKKLSMAPFGELAWHVEEFSTGEELLDAIFHQSRSFDLILMDQILTLAGGKLYGSDCSVLVRQHEHKLCLPQSIIIAVTGSVSQADIQLYHDSGMDYVWSKPVPKPVRMYRDLVRIYREQTSRHD